MSVLRIARPGYPLKVIDEGPSTAYRAQLYSSSGAVMGGELVRGVSEKQAQLESQRAYTKRKRGTGG